MILAICKSSFFCLLFSSAMRDSANTRGARTPFLLPRETRKCAYASPGVTSKCAYVDLKEKRVSALTVNPLHAGPEAAKTKIERFRRKWKAPSESARSFLKLPVSALTSIFSIYAQNALFSFLTVLAFADVNSPARKTRSR